MFNWFREFKLRRQIRREQKLRERCIKYGGGNELRGASIYRFIVKGTYIDSCASNPTKEYIYPNLEGVIHQGKNQLMY